MVTPCEMQSCLTDRALRVVARARHAVPLLSDIYWPTSDGCRVRPNHRGAGKKKARDRLRHRPRADVAALGLNQAGSRLPVPVNRLGAAIECIRERISSAP